MRKGIGVLAISGLVLGCVSIGFASSASAETGVSLTVNSASLNTTTDTATIGYTASGLTVGTKYGTRLIDTALPDVQADGNGDNNLITVTSTSMTSTAVLVSTFGEDPVTCDAKNVQFQIVDSASNVLASAPVSFPECQVVPPPTCTQVSDAQYAVTIDGVAGTASVTLTNGPLCNPGAVSLAAYKSRGANATPTSDDPQDLVDLEPATISSGSTNLKVTGCYNQLDVILGHEAPAVLTSNQLSGAGILLKSFNTDSTVCVNKPTTPPSSVPPTSSTPTTSTTPPAASTSVPTTAASTIGPKVVTDQVGHESNTSYMGVAVGALLSLMALGTLGWFGNKRASARRH